MSINLSITFNHPDAIANAVAYARIDNTINPVFVNVSPNIAGNGGTFRIASNIPDGQYQVNITPIYADGRVCAPTVVITDPCPTLISISAEVIAGNMVISYLAPSQAPKVRMTVNFPNGGSSVANYVNNGNNIVVALPPNLPGSYTVAGQSVCDESSGFYSAFSNLVTVVITSVNVSIGNFVNGITISAVAGIASFTLAQLIAFGQTVTGNHTAFYSGITLTFTGTQGTASSATLAVNGTIIQCENVPNTDGGSIVFSPASFANTDQLTITINNGVCP